MGRPSHRPDDKTREQVERTAGYGLTHDQIARVIGVSDETLRKYYREELHLGVAHANAEVAKSLYQRATKDKNVVACIFWLKCRANWKETEVLRVEDNRTVDELSAAELRAIVARAERPRTDRIEIDTDVEPH